nr:J257 [uncultured bacterium]
MKALRQVAADFQREHGLVVGLHALHQHQGAAVVQELDQTRQQPALLMARQGGQQQLAIELDDVDAQRPQARQAGQTDAVIVDRHQTANLPVMGHRIGQRVTVLHAALGDFHHHPRRIETAFLQYVGQEFAMPAVARHHQRRHVQEQPAVGSAGLALKIAQVQQPAQGVQFDQAGLVQATAEEPERRRAPPVGIVETDQSLVAHHPAGAQCHHRLEHARQAQAAELALPETVVGLAGQGLKMGKLRGITQVRHGVWHAPVNGHKRACPAWLAAGRGTRGGMLAPRDASAPALQPKCDRSLPGLVSAVQTDAECRRTAFLYPGGAGHN